MLFKIVLISFAVLLQQIGLPLLGHLGTSENTSEGALRHLGRGENISGSALRHYVEVIADIRMDKLG